MYVHFVFLFVVIIGLLTPVMFHFFASSATYIFPETTNVFPEEVDLLFESSAWKEEAAVK